MHGARPLRGDATRWASLLPAGEDVILHVSGCAKGCARPFPTPRLRSRLKADTISSSPEERPTSPCAVACPAWRLMRFLAGEGAKTVEGERPAKRERSGYQLREGRRGDLSPGVRHHPHGRPTSGNSRPSRSGVAVEGGPCLRHGRGGARPRLHPRGGRGGEAARLKPAPLIFCDARMVTEGVTRARLPAENEVICTLADPSTPALAEKLGDDAHGRGARPLAAPACRRRRRDRQCADGPFPAHLSSSPRSAPSPRPRHWHAGRLRRRRGIEGGADRERLCQPSQSAERKGGSAMAAAAVNALASEAE